MAGEVTEGAGEVTEEAGEVTVEAGVATEEAGEATTVDGTAPVLIPRDTLPPPLSYGCSPYLIHMILFKTHEAHPDSFTSL